MGDNPAPVKASKCVVRKYDPEYIKSGIIMVGSDAETKRTEYGEILSQPTSLFLLFCHVVMSFHHLFWRVIVRFY